MGVKCLAQEHNTMSPARVGQVRLYSRLTCAQKRRTYKFVPRLLPMIADSRPSRFTVAVVSSRSVFQAHRMGRFCI